MSEADIRAERLKKLKILRDAGMEAYPASSKRDTPISDFVANFEKLEKSEKVLTVAGRIMALRGQGGIAFADVFDGSARAQIVLQADGGADVELFSKVVDTGDFAQFT